MSAFGPRDAARPDGSGSLFTVTVIDEVEDRLAGHAGCRYASPAQPLADARALVRLLLGGAVGELDGARQWTRPIAGGRRTVTLTRCDRTH